MLNCEENVHKNAKKYLLHSFNFECQKLYVTGLLTQFSCYLLVIPETLKIE